MPPSESARGHAAGAHDQRRVVAGVRVDDAAGVGLDAGVAERGEPAARHVAAQQPVDARADRRAARPTPARTRAPRPAGSTSAAPRAAPCRRCRRSTPRATRPNVSVSKQSPPTPLAGCQATARSMPADSRHHRRQQAALNQPRVLELALLAMIAAARRAGVGDLPLQDLEQRDVLPRLLHEALGAAAHRLDRGVDAAPPGHDHDRQRRIVAAHARDRARAPHAPRWCRACSSGPSAADRTARPAAAPSPRRSS